MKKIVFVVVAAILLITAPVIVYFVGNQQDIRSRAAPATTLSFSPSTISAAVDSQFTLNVAINTGTNSVTAVKLVITFDSTKLEATSITNGEFAPKITASGVVSSGTASITVAADSTVNPIKGTGTIAVLRMKGKAGTTTPVTVKFDASSFASGLSESTNVLTTTGVASVSITGSTVVPTPTPTTANSSNTLITPTPTAIPTPTPTEEATVSAEPVQSDEVPVTGSTETTVALLAVGVSFLCISSLLYMKGTRPI